MIRAVLRKELVVLWASPAPWVAGAVFQAVLAVLFIDQLQGRGQAVVQPLFPIAGLLVVVATPALTMRAFAEEQRSRNLDVLLATPVPVWPLAVGKWLASWLTVAAMVAPSLAMVGLTALWGQPDAGPIVTGYAGLLLLAGALAALGVATSAATDSQALAAMVAIFVGLVLWFVGSATGGSSTARALQSLSLSEHLRTFASGGVDVGDVAFLLGAAALALATATVLVVPRARTMALVAVLVALTMWGSAQHRLVDLTQHETLTLAPVTRTVVRAVRDTTTITAFVGRRDPARVDAVTLLDRYARLNRRVRVEVVDPADAPGRVRAAGIDPILGGVTVRRGARVELVAGTSEQDITSALARLSRGRDVTVCQTTGHGEAEIAADAIEAAGYVVRPIDLLASPEVPKGCSVVLISAPRQDLGAAEQAVARWVADDGKAMVLVDPAADVSVAAVLSPFGLGVRRGIVFEGEAASTVNGDATAPIVRRYSSAHPIVRGLPPTYFPGAEEITVDPSVRAPGLTVARLADTSETSYLETDPNGASFDPSTDGAGPITVAVAADQSRVVSDTEVARTRLVVVGDVDFASPGVVGTAANGRFLLQALGWLSLDDDLIPLSSNLGSERPLELTDARVDYARFLGVVAVPAMFLLGGAAMWLARRRA